MEITSSLSALSAVRTQLPQQQVQNTQQTAAASDGNDREPDGDSDDRGSVTATRGQNLNITA